MKVKAGLFGTVVTIAGVASGCVYNTPPVGAVSGFGDVATIAKNDVWAVGSTATSNSAASHALVEHFDGRSWRVVAMPADSGTTLNSITAVSASDVWAVGGGHTLHWDGHSWTATADPANLAVVKVEHGHGGLVMALGVNTSSGDQKVLARSGSTWVPIATPTPPLPTSGRPCDAVLQLRALTVLTQNDLWVAGGTSNSGNTVTAGCPYAAHWNGSSWTTYAPPNPTGEPISELAAISARADGTVWSVGQAQAGGPQSEPGFAVRWNGTTWQSLCNFGCGPITWTDIDATGTSVWASGVELLGAKGDVMGISRWVGNGWAAQSVQKIIAPPATIPGNILTSVSVRSGTVTTGGFYFGINPSNHTTTSTPLVDIRSEG